MDIIKVAGIGLVAAVLALTVKNQRPDMGFQISIAAGVVIVLIVCTNLSPVLNFFQSLTRFSGMDNFYVGIILKIIGISFVSDMVSDLCTDAGEEAIGKKVELAGKVGVLLVALPLFDSLLKLVQVMMR